MLNTNLSFNQACDRLEKYKYDEIDRIHSAHTEDVFWYCGRVCPYCLVEGKYKAGLLQQCTECDAIVEYNSSEEKNEAILKDRPHFIKKLSQIVGILQDLVKSIYGW
jgi:transcription initiation factor IIE alpha subunit